MLRNIFIASAEEIYLEQLQVVGYVLGLAAVCSRWRAIALTYRPLWRYIDIYRPRLASLFLNRLGPSSRVIYVSSGTHRSPPFDFTMVSHCADRVEAIDLSVTLGEMRAFIHHTDLHLDSISDLRLRITSSIESPLHITLPLSSVSHLSLEGVTANWGALWNLTHLHLCQIHGRFSPSLADLRSILRLSTSLHTLVLDRVSLSLSEIVFYEYRRHLRLLRVDLHPWCAKRIISGIRLPLDALLDVRARADDLEEIFVESEHRHLSTPRHTMLFLGPRKIVLGRSGSEAFSEHGARMVIRLTANMNVRVLEPISKIFMFNNIKTLDMHFMHPDRKDLAETIWIFRGFFNRLHSLATLRVSQALAGIIVPILGELSTDDEVICPKLWWLSLGDPDQLWWGFPTAPSGSLDGGWLEPIVEGLRERCRYQAMGVVEFLGRGRIEFGYAHMRLGDFVGRLENKLSPFA